MTPKPHPRIAIAGGGPAALTLGALLHQRAIPFTIFELRAQPTAADLAQPSGMLDLHEESGLAAIRACGLWEQFLPLTADCAESMIVADGSTGDVLHADDDDEGGGEEGDAYRPEIARHNITKLMLGVVPPEAVRWETKIVGAKRDEASSGETMLELRQGNGGATSTETFDLVIGADGAWSRIRALLTDAVPRATHLHYITLTIRNLTTRFPALAERVGKGSYAALARRHGIMTQRGTQDSAMVMFFVNDAGVGAEHVRSLGGLATVGELRGALLGDERLFGGFASGLKELAGVAFDEEEEEEEEEEEKERERLGAAKSEFKPLVMLPPGKRWTLTPGVTVIGDAAHVMLPTAGEGVNCAMRDALELSEVIGRAWEEAASSCDVVAGGDGGSGERFREVLGPLLGEFEKVMIARAAEFSNEAMENAETMFSEDGAKGMAAFMAMAHEGHGPPEGSGKGEAVPGEAVGAVDH
ncbi:unnamed protein product [Discula destructiva]